MHVTVPWRLQAVTMVVWVAGLKKRRDAPLIIRRVLVGVGSIARHRTGRLWGSASAPGHNRAYIRNLHWPHALPSKSAARRESRCSPRGALMRCLRPVGQQRSAVLLLRRQRRPPLLQCWRHVLMARQRQGPAWQQAAWALGPQRTPAACVQALECAVPIGRLGSGQCRIRHTHGPVKAAAAQGPTSLGPPSPSPGPLGRAATVPPVPGASTPPPVRSSLPAGTGDCGGSGGGGCVFPPLCTARSGSSTHGVGAAMTQG